METSWKQMGNLDSFSGNFSNSNNFCKCCDYYSSDKCNFKRHLQTMKKWKKWKSLGKNIDFWGSEICEENYGVNNFEMDMKKLHVRRSKSGDSNEKIKKQKNEENLRDFSGLPPKNERGNNENEKNEDHCDNIDSDTNDKGNKFTCRICNFNTKFNFCTYCSMT